MDVDERRQATLIHDDIRCQNRKQLFMMNFEGAKSPMFIVCFYVLVVLFVCMFMVFEVCNSKVIGF
jgi:hypothetical protein